jgi:integrase
MERALPEPYGSGPGAGGWGASEPGLEGDAMARYLQEQLERGMPVVAKHHLEELTTQIRKFYVGKYKHRPCKYGSLNKGFTEQEVQAFFFGIDNDEFRLLFEYQANLALRIGEVVKVNVKNINFETRELKLRSEKSRKLDSLRIPEHLFRETLNYIREYREEITKCNGYLFFRNRAKSKRGDDWIEPNYVRKKFREYVIKAGIDETYDVSEESDPKRATRSLHRLTTHSLRHFAITRFSREVNGNLVMACQYARHANPNTTMVYIHSDKRELYEAIERATNYGKDMIST